MKSQSGVCQGGGAPRAPQPVNWAMGARPPGAEAPALLNAVAEALRHQCSGGTLEPNTQPLTSRVWFALIVEQQVCVGKLLVEGKCTSCCSKVLNL